MNQNQNPYDSIRPLADRLFAQGGMLLRAFPAASKKSSYKDVRSRIVTDGDTMNAFANEMNSQGRCVYYFPNYMVKETTGKNAGRYTGADHTCKTINVFRADIDGVTIPDDWRTNKEAGCKKWKRIRTASDILRKHGMRPSYVAATGGGVHIVYFLEPESCGENHQWHTKAVDDLAFIFDGDHSITNVGRIWRLPGTVNTKPKYPAGTRCYILTKDWGAVIDAQSAIKAIANARGELNIPDPPQPSKSKTSPRTSTTANAGNNDLKKMHDLGARAGKFEPLSPSDLDDLCFKCESGNVYKRLKIKDHRSGAMFVAAKSLVALGKSDAEIESYFMRDKSVMREKLLEMGNDRRELERTLARARAYVTGALGQAAAGDIPPEHRSVLDGAMNQEAQLENARRLNREFFAIVGAGVGYGIVESSQIQIGRPLPVINAETFRRDRLPFSYPMKIPGGKDGSGKWQSMTDGEIWQYSPIQRKYRGVKFAPDQDISTCDNFVAGSAYNLWKGLPAYDPPAATGAMDGRFLDWTRNIICNGDDEAYEWTMDYLAGMVQRPYELKQCFLAIFGEKGTGKSLWAKIVSRLMRPEHRAFPPGLEGVIKNFNSQDAAAVIMVCDEAGIFAGRHADDEGIKRLTTEATRRIEGKHKDAYYLRNCVHLIIITNNNWCAHATEDERRSVVYEVNNQYSELGSLGLAAGKEAADAMMADLFDNGGIGHLIHRLLDRDISQWKPASFLQIAKFRDAISRQAGFQEDSVQAWLSHFYNLQEPTPDAAPHMRDQYARTKALWGSSVSPKLLYENYYRPFMGSARNREKIREFTRKLRRILPPDWRNGSVPEKPMKRLGDDWVNDRMTDVFVPKRDYGDWLVDRGGWLKVKRAECKNAREPYSEIHVAAALAEAKEGVVPDMGNDDPPQQAHLRVIGDDYGADGAGWSGGDF